MTDRRPVDEDGKTALIYKDDEPGAKAGEFFKEPATSAEMRAESLGAFSGADIDYVKGILREFGDKADLDEIEASGLGDSAAFIQTLLGYKTVFDDNLKDRDHHSLGQQDVRDARSQEIRGILSAAILEGKANHIATHGPMPANFGGLGGED